MTIPHTAPPLEGKHVRLEPLGREHIPALTDIGLDPDLWRWTVTQVGTPQAMADYVESALNDRALGRALPFATLDRATGRVVGCTRFGSIDRHHRRVEIGWTWVGRRWQRTSINTEAKFLMLRHAFDVLDCIRVELKTDALNERSRNAIRRLGATEEGTLRNHMVTDSGRVRDTVYYSIVAEDGRRCGADWRAWFVSMPAFDANAGRRIHLRSRVHRDGENVVSAPSSLHRLAAFTDSPEGGNPAGVWVGAALPTVEDMQRIAADVGFSETAFVAPATGFERTVRYFSPEAEVTFCGHATIAAGVVLGRMEGDGTFTLASTIGDIPVTVRSRDGIHEASLVSVEPMQMSVSDTLLTSVLTALHWRIDELDPSIPPARAYAGAWHLVLAVSRAERLASLDYDYDELKAVMLEDGLTTLQLVWRESPYVFHARNPFPVGGVVEDPATGAAAAALGGYLRAAGHVTVPGSIVIRQGEAMGRPSRIVVEIPATGGIVVTGGAVEI
ncbi:MAG: PhzF family phenazine biosynthesis isomerase [Gemmatimonadetes bacterium]|nr:PhzF family phenazine biosynthesis isomerase [Gemmatimonadota bacterium]